MVCAWLQRHMRLLKMYVYCIKVVKIKKAIHKFATILPQKKVNKQQKKLNVNIINRQKP